MSGIADHQVWRVASEICAARDADAAEPLLVGSGAVVASDGEGEHRFRRGVALDLLEGVVEVLVVLGGVVVVDVTQLRDCEVWVGRHRIGDLGAECEIKQHGTIVVCTQVSTIHRSVEVNTPALVEKFIGFHNLPPPPITPFPERVEFPTMARTPVYVELRFRPVM